MSMVRLVTRIVPRDAPLEEVSRLLTPEQVDVPVRTTRNNSSAVLTAETTFCRAVAVPSDFPDTDAAVAAKCEGISGLACLKKSRLRRVAEEAGLPDTALKVVPEVNAEGQCTGMLLSIPLRIPRSEVGPSKWPADTNRTTLSVTGAEDGGAFGGTQLNQNTSTSLSYTGAEDGNSFAFSGTQLNRNLSTTHSIANDEHIQTTHYPNDSFKGFPFRRRSRRRRVHIFRNRYRPTTPSVTGAKDRDVFPFDGTQLNQNLSTTHSIANDEHIQTTHSDAGAGGFPLGGMQLDPNRNHPTNLSVTGAEDGSSFAFGGTQQWPIETNRNGQTSLSVTGAEYGRGFAFGGMQLNRNLSTNISMSNNEHVPTTHSAARTGSYSFGETHQEPNRNLQTDVSNGELHRAERNVSVSCNGQTSPRNTCYQCGERFQGKKKLILHMKRVHEGVRCPFCDTRFESGKGLKGHMSSEHAGELPHVCDVCSARFRTAETLKNHYTQHRRRFRCEECGKGFSQKGLLQGHRSSVHGHS